MWLSIHIVFLPPRFTLGKFVWMKQSVPRFKQISSLSLFFSKVGLKKKKKEYVRKEKNEMWKDYIISSWNNVQGYQSHWGRFQVSRWWRISWIMNKCTVNILMLCPFLISSVCKYLACRSPECLPLESLYRNLLPYPDSLYFKNMFIMAWKWSWPNAALHSSQPAVRGWEPHWALKSCSEKAGHS